MSGLIPDSRDSIKYRKLKSRKGNPNNFIEEVGQRYGRLTVIQSNGKYGNDICWLCKCDCGNQVTVRGFSLRRKDTLSCGCLHKEVIARTNRSRANPCKLKLKQMALELQSQGLSLKAIAGKFTLNEIPTLSGKSNVWRAASVRWLLIDN